MKKNDNEHEENEIFHEAMRGVKPLKPSTKITPPAAHRKPPTRKSQPDPDALPLAFSDNESIDPVSSEALLEFHRPGIQHKILRKLRAGQYNIDGVLDLHGMNVAEAKESLQHFLLKCHRNGARHVLMIHGKGRSNSNPILKNKLNHWLRQANSVLAFCSATARDGRSGALYVLLKNIKGEIVI